MLQVRGILAERTRQLRILEQQWVREKQGHLMKHGARCEVVPRSMAVGAGPTLKGGIHTDARGPRQEQVPGDIPTPQPRASWGQDEATPCGSQAPEPLAPI